MAMNYYFFPLSNPNQNIFSKNFELLKTQYRKLMSPNLEIDLLKFFYVSEGEASFFEKMYDFSCMSKRIKVFLEFSRFLEFEEQSSVSSKKIYVFLGLLTFFEATLEKGHRDFSHENWQFFANQILFSPLDKVLTIIKTLFKNNLKYYKWTQEEDDLLKTLIFHNNPNQTKKNSWTSLAKQFNSEKIASMARTPSQLKERWDNSLKTEFKTGKWNLQEDIYILKFVEKNGSKWARIARSLRERNEHNVKNRFFSLISEFLQMPIKRVKKEICYLNSELIKEAMMFFQKTK